MPQPLTRAETSSLSSTEQELSGFRRSAVPSPGLETVDVGTARAIRHPLASRVLSSGGTGVADIRVAVAGVVAGGSDAKKRSQRNGREQMGALTAELAQHGLRIVFSNVLLQQIGVPIPAEPTLIVAGSLAAREVLSGSAVVLAALAAIVIADVSWFVLGRWFGRRVLGFVSRLVRAPEARMRETERAFARWGLKSLIIAKFLPGVSQLLLPMAGAMGARLRTVLFYDLLGGVIWTSATVGGGMFFHRQVESLLAAPPRVGIWALAGAGVAGVAFIIWFWRRRHPAITLTAAPTSAELPAAGWASVGGGRRGPEAAPPRAESMPAQADRWPSSPPWLQS